MLRNTLPKTHVHLPVSVDWESGMALSSAVGIFIECPSVVAELQASEGLLSELTGCW